MNNLNKSFLLFALAGLFMMNGCKKKDEPKPAAQMIAKSWKVSQVKEDGIVVYTSSLKTVDYSKFKLVFTATGVTLTEFDNTNSTGTWSLSSNNTVLDLTGLNPAPTDTGGNIKYTGVTVSETELKITRAGKNAKTGKSNVEYTLIP